MIVADVNLIVYLLIEGTRTAGAKQVYERDPVWVVPRLWRSEFLNVMASSVRAGMLTEHRAQSVWESALTLVGDAEQEPDPSEVLHLAVRRKVSAYDAQYVVVARMLGTVVVTGDRDLVRRCPEHAVLIDDFLSDGPTEDQ